MVVNPSLTRIELPAGDGWSCSMKDESAQHRPRRSRLVMGIFLLVVGALMLAVNLGFGLPEGWWRYLPWLLIAFGLWGLAVPSRHLDRVGGVWMFATGLYFLFGLYHWWGLGWGGAWPIFVIAAGLGFILHRHDEGSPPRAGDDPGNGVS
ncbi:hypothetical protein JM946_04025 [Steroidobacter sp. S1-65]|uniref:LiaF transmembrane domain-containing protein n=1 Tax=Steroidobacter gossypii TaxID=2805490 RepID=A0ABS1WSD3_9GAMM|nr:hypothetical protein [Steroidobacter gossypii]MBM0103893.1 hypothetical protein [Steroidobacter gossypii]